jgi:hypothetical protein
MARGKKTGGRKKGTVNKATASVKEAIIKAFDGIGGMKSFEKWAKENPDDFYTKMYVKVMPTEIKTPDGSPFFVKVLDMRDEPDDGNPSTE